MASVSIAVATSSAAVDLTALGGEDYHIYQNGTALPGGYRKSGGGSLIAVSAATGNGTFGESKVRYFSASDATPTLSGTSNYVLTNVAWSGLSTEFGYNWADLPAGTGERTVKLYVAIYSAGSSKNFKCYAVLNGAAVSDTETFTSTAGSMTYHVITITYTADGTDTLDIYYGTDGSSVGNTTAVFYGATWLDDETSSGVTGTSTTTNANDTSSASGSPIVNGTSTTTNANDTSSAAGTTTVVGTSTTTNANDTSSAAGTTTVVGTSTTTNANDTSTASGSPVVNGTSTTTNANDTATASGTVDTTIAGTSATTNADDTSAASGTTTIAGTSTTTNADDTSAASGTTTVIGTSATTNADDTSTASGIVGDGTTGTSATTNADDTSAASGTTTVVGTAAIINANDTAYADGGFNVALATNGGTASASSTVGVGYAAQYAINGDRRGLNWGVSGGWNDGTNNVWPDYLTVQFNKAYTINRINVFSVQDNYPAPAIVTTAMQFTLYGLVDFNVQMWGGSAWQDIPGASITGNTLIWRQFDFDQIVTDRIRLKIDAALDQWSRVTEIEAFAEVYETATGTAAIINNNDTAAAVGSSGTGAKSGVDRQRLSALTEALSKKPARKPKQVKQNKVESTLVITPNADGSITVQDKTEIQPLVEFTQEIVPVSDYAEAAPVVTVPQVFDQTLLAQILQNAQALANIEQQNTLQVQNAVAQKAAILKQQQEDELIIQYAIEVLL